MNNKPLALACAGALLAALTLSACDRRDAGTAPTPQTAPGTDSNSTTPGGGTSTTPPAGGTGGSMGGTGGTGSGSMGGTGTMPSDSAASAPGTGASR
ncbi:MAG TPA: hypothetical protein VFR90_08435 [Methylibium sp.]|uniref:hypothetical protein n=1 Tax=Methylibium sp. TaxID=2067992 RepID=UPI002DBC0F2D|nr:hypothetical protein [Methylibium sp.]HEU4459133.1 hypothetical protein [Methylibium sp.]